MMLYVIATAFLLPSVLGNCCFPTQLSGSFFQSETGAVFRIKVDFNEQKTRIEPVGHSPSVDFILNDYNTATVYTQLKDGTCKKIAAPLNTLPKCIPQNATNVGNSYFGSSNNPINISGFRFKLGTEQVFMTVTKANCVPVSVVTQQNGSTQTNLYYNQSTAAFDKSFVNVDTKNCV